MRLLALLSNREASVQELTDELESSHQNVSKHLGVLYQSGMVSRRKEGNRVRYALSDYTACKLIGDATASITGHVEELAAIVGVSA
jgi:DNA-binding transcriptional ArsR family regulator